MTCRCGHGRHTHRRGQGHKRLPCWARTGPYNPAATKGHGICKCRDWHPEEPK